MTDEVDAPILYVLMRTDLPDYQPGKCMAQANHAGTLMIAVAAEKRGEQTHLDEYMTQWLAEAGGFGTCGVLGVTYRQLLNRVHIAGALGLLTGIVEDPTYPIRDGHKMQTLPVDTCGFVFGLRSECEPLVGDLHRFGRELT